MDRQLGSALAALRDAADSMRCSGELLDLGPCVEAFAELCQGLFSDEGMSFAIAIVFDEENGLFGIVKSLVTLRDRSVAEAREQCWPLVELTGSRALPYAPLWKEICLLYFRRDDAKGIQAAALTPLIALLESNMTQSKAATFEVNQELSDMLVREFQKSKRSSTCSVENSRKAFTYMEQILLPREELKRCEPLNARV